MQESTRTQSLSFDHQLLYALLDSHCCHVLSKSLNLLAFSLNRQEFNSCSCLTAISLTPVFIICTKILDILEVPPRSLGVPQEALLFSRFEWNFGKLLTICSFVSPIFKETIIARNQTVNGNHHLYRLVC